MPNEFNSIHSGNPVNNTQDTAPRRSSTFNLSHKFANTLRFGDVSPFFVMESVPRDSKIPFRSVHNLFTNSFKSPMSQTMNLKKAYFNVPLQSILPLQYDRIFANPNIGDDVPEDCNCVIDTLTIKNFLDGIRSTIGTVYSQIPEEPTDAEKEDFSNILLSYIISYLVQSEYFLSNGSLIKTLGCSICQNIYNIYKGTEDSIYSFDKMFDEIISNFVDLVESIKIVPFGLGPSDDAGALVSSDLLETHSYLYSYYNMRSFLSFVRDNGYVEIHISKEDCVSNFADIISFVQDFLLFELDDNDFSNSPLNLSRVFAYQLAYAHYFSNDRVDYIYSAELYRQNVFDIVKQIVSFDISVLDTFEWNGINLPYDYLSGHFIGNAYEVSFDDKDAFKSCLKLSSLIFGYRASLKFGDYFTGAKTRPLAVGDTSVQVADSSVNVVDVTRNIQIQRFLNAVNNSGRKISNYIKNIFGSEVSYDYHDPLYLGETIDTVFSEHIENTADAQQDNANSITSVMKSNSEKYAFTFSSDRESILIGVCYFDIPRLYGLSTDRQFFNINRYDSFNPFLEYTGDQPIYLKELRPLGGDYDYFGYTSRYMEYKQRFNRAAGGFVENLPGYSFIADNVKGLPQSAHLSPSYIRSSNVELDEFFVSLTGYSLGSYFHFIVFFDNLVEDAIRPMSYQPQIL